MADGLGRITEHIKGQHIVCTDRTSGNRMARAHTTRTERLVYKDHANTRKVVQSKMHTKGQPTRMHTISQRDRTCIGLGFVVCFTDPCSWYLDPATTFISAQKGLGQYTDRLNDRLQLH